MKKIAIFVEGHTEAEFLYKLVFEVLGKKSFGIKSVQFSGSAGERHLTVVKAQKAPSQPEYYFMIFNCCSDESVKSDILERYKRMEAENYAAIKGVRDIYPQTNIPALRRGIAYGIPTGGVMKIDIVLAQMEIESWFFGEEFHYSKVHPNLNHTHASTQVGFDITKESTEAVLNPALDLHLTYQTVGLAYHKRAKQVQRTVGAINYENLYVNVRARNHSLDEFFTCFERAL